MPLSVVGAGGGSSPTAPGRELGYAQITHVYNLVDASLLTPIPGLSIDLNVPLGVRFCVEAYLPQIAQLSGAPLGDLMYTAITIAGSNFQVNYSFTNPTTGDGMAVYLRTPSFDGDGVVDTYAVAIENLTAGLHGASVSALTESPAFIRVLAV